MFELSKFIIESNLIDPQLDLKGKLIPGLKPGDPLYDNQLDAWQVMTDFAHSNNIPITVAKDIHRALTKNVDFFESRDMSGEYRNCNVRIGWEMCPNHEVVPDLMEHMWFPELNNLKTTNNLIPEDDINFDGDRIFVDNLSWRVHNLFEVIHPFIDGNGRTGRLLLNMIRIRLGVEPIIIEYDKRFEYYDKIKYFRKMDYIMRNYI